MRRDGEQVATKPVEIESVSLEEVKPKEIEDFECPDITITDEVEKIGVLLKLNWIEEEPLKWLKDTRWIGKITNATWDDVYYIEQSQVIIPDIIRWLFEQLYYNHYAYLKKWPMLICWPCELQGEWEIEYETPYGKMELPILSVEWKILLFPRKFLMTDDEKNVFELSKINQDSFDDRWELEKEIISKIIAYTTSEKKSLSNIKETFDKIKEESEKIWGVERIVFTWSDLKIHFNPRMIVDSQGKYPNWVAPSFAIRVNVLDRTIEWEWLHPHLMTNWSLCMWWELTALRDRCFKNKDIYGLVMWLIQFWNTWNSRDAAWDSRRNLGSQLITAFNQQTDNANTKVQYAIDLNVKYWISFSDIFLTTCFSDYLKLFDTIRSYFLEQLQREESLRDLYDRREALENVVGINISTILESFRNRCSNDREREIVNNAKATIEWWF